ncbi:MAG: cupin domain-containing protein [Mycolicibacterium sp.]|uniref:cupin domain-containing protein n=1 Tax=Mycolicibacterium sp. TaxID=2320850 RepID=UPI003D102A4F
MNSARRRTSAAVLTTIGIAAVSLASATTAVATPSAGVQVVTLSANTVNGTDYVTREITIAPGGSTGWHYHEPIVYGIIRSGTLTWTPSNCVAVQTYPAGSAVAEHSGPDHVHLGRNLGTEPVVMWVNYVAPAGTPPAVSVPDPGCGFA